MKTLSVTAIVLLVGAGFVWLFPWASALVSDQRGQLDNVARDNVSDEYIVQQAREGLATAQAEIQSKLAQVIGSKQKLASVDAELAQLRKNLDGNRQKLVLAQEWLNSHQAGDTLPMNGMQLPYDEVASRARLMVEQSKGLEQTIAAQEANRQMLQTAIAEADKTIRGALGTIRAKQGEIQAKEIQLAAFRATEETRKFADSLKLNGDLFANQNRFYEELDRRLNEMKAGQEISQSLSADLPFGADVDARSDLDALNEYLAPATSAATPAQPTEPSAQATADALAGTNQL